MRRILAFTGLCVVLALTAVVVGGPDGDSKAADPTEGASYVGEAKCKKCHMKEHRTWKKMLHKKAFDNLPEKHHGDKDDKGRACISCHTTGYGQADRKGWTSEADKHLEGVQCEACHGAGSNHVAAATKVTDEKREFAEGEKKFIVLKTDNCSDCHNPHISYKKKYGGD